MGRGEANRVSNNPATDILYGNVPSRDDTYFSFERTLPNGVIERVDKRDDKPVRAVVPEGIEYEVQLERISDIGVAEIVSQSFTGAVTLYMTRGLLHRLDGPAVEYSNGNKEWFLNGRIHRDDGPAREYADGGFEYWVDGKEHREDGPSSVTSDGLELWAQNGKLHRLDGPALIGADGGEEWYKDGMPHREDGPAIIHSFEKNSQPQWTDDTKQFYKVPILQEYWLNGRRHRLDGPAIEYVGGYESWYVNDQKHRDDGPAITRPDREEWFRLDQRHREDGPAVVFTNGEEQYWINGKQLTTDQFSKYQVLLAETQRD